MRPILLAAVLALAAVPAAAQTVSTKLPPAVVSEPAPDARARARMEVIHVPVGGVAINGVVYVAQGPGPHPTLVILHGLPGNEKHLDLAQAVRRAGWNAVTFNYRGSWGSPGPFSFGQTLIDTKFVLAYLRDPANAAKLGVDPRRIAIAGHSMGGWVTAETAARDPALLGAILISAADMGQRGVSGKAAPAALAAAMDANRETLAGATGQSMAEELIAGGEAWRLDALGPGLKTTRLLVLHSDDGLAPDAERLIAAIHAAGGTKVQDVHVATDHGWSDKRLTLQALVINWLAGL
ncbi:alpha/beta hydrolase family protein [Phenylobacterium sp.]|uniref:alpha/beta hydrolase family protein n=1 Tax=Phenylobacterium sp. TaxID=1871053 RepID=UPI003BA97791